MEDNSQISIKAWYQRSLVTFASRLEPTRKDSILKSRVTLRQPQDDPAPLIGYYVKGVLG